MSDAVWAVPGLMPPHPGNAMKRIVSPEDGSLKLLLWVGRADASVSYALDIPGWRGGRIKDPDYGFGKLTPAQRRDIDTWPDYLYPEESCIPGTIIPMTECECGYTVPLDECLGAGEGDTWFILQLPPHTLPEGPTSVDAIVDGKVYRHIVNRPHSNMHGGRDVTPRLYKHLVQMKKDTSFHVKALTPAQRALDICMLRHPSLPADAEVSAVAEANGKQIPIGASLDHGALLLDIPALPVGEWGYTVRYASPEGVMRLLVQGTVTSGDVSQQNSVTYGKDGMVEFCYLADKEDLSSLLNGAKFAPGVWIFAPNARIGVEAFSYSTCTTVAGTMDRLECAVGMFRGSTIRELPAELPALGNARSMCVNSRLCKAPCMPMASDMDNTFAGCTDLDTLPPSYPAARTARGAFSGCDNILYPCALPAALDCERCFAEARNLRRIASTPSAENLDGCYYKCTLLAEVPDDTYWPRLQTAVDAFTGCVSLTTNAVAAILAALPDRNGDVAIHTVTLPDTPAARAASTTEAEAKRWTVLYA